MQNYKNLNDGNLLTDNLLKNEFKVFYHSIPVVDDEVSDVTSEPGTPSDNKPITTSKARGLTLYEKTNKKFCS